MHRSTQAATCLPLVIIVAISLLAVGAVATNDLSVPGGKIYAAGSGLDMLSQPATVAEIIALTGKPAAQVRVLYLGTATYDDAAAQATQTRQFAKQGCAVAALAVAVATPSDAAMRAAVGAADVILVSGGNTLFARDRWVKIGLDALMKGALARGAVLCGGSAGGIVWFDGGHSDSMDATTYKNPPGPLLNPNLTKAELERAWAYIRVPGLSVVPGLFCPHYDITEGNGVLRAVSFAGMMRRHAGEHALGVDNWAALRIDGANYTVISRAGKPGSVNPETGAYTPDRAKGVPGAWRLGIDPATGALARTLVPARGRVADLLAPARYVTPSEMLGVARLQNPDDGRPPSATAVLRVK